MKLKNLNEIEYLNEIEEFIWNLEFKNEIEEFK